MNNTMDMNGHDELCVGIDLGTTYSVIATINVKKNGELVSKVVDVPRAKDICAMVGGKTTLSSGKEHTLPSCVYYREEREYEPLVGGFAKQQYSLRPHLVAKSIKSQMGKPLAEGLSENIPDKTPAEISSRILKHLLNETAKIYHKKEITDAVITVPANFDPVMCKATLDAARLAGIQVTNSDGSTRPVLLSEPNAVIYDFVNQSVNGEIAGDILDLSSKKNVMVFDLGGGTLDITMHEIEHREGEQNILKIKDLATNRYTLLGGNDFDEIIAESMYERYLKQYAGNADVQDKLRREKKQAMSQLRVYAELLKMDLNERCGTTYSSGWDDEEDEIRMDAGGSMTGIGYAYSDSFTKEEVEQILNPLMAEHLQFSDFKRISEITDTRNIIYPILDVLDKTLQKLKEEKEETDTVKVDAVIVNGGMTKFYMITERLTRFFGFEPTVVLDPDLAVARGAAVYHHYLHRYNVLQDDMRIVDAPACDIAGKQPALDIQWGKSILNDSLYLGVKNNAVHQIIPTGVELPYCSAYMTGFSMEPGQNMISIPIKSRNIDGSYRTIASGKLTFRQKYTNGAYVALQVCMGSNKIITMRAWTSKDEQGLQRVEEGSVEIALGHNEGIKKSRVNAPSGSVLDPVNEIRNVTALCHKQEKLRDAKTKGEMAKRISQRVKLICYAGNKEAFAEPILSELAFCNCETAKHRLFRMARALGSTWNESQRNKLARLCMNQLESEMKGLPAMGVRVSAHVEAIMTLSICGTKEHLKGLRGIHNNSRYHQACLFVHGKTGTELDWLYSEFCRDITLAERGIRNNLQFSAQSMGHALKKSNAIIENVSLCEDVVMKLLRSIKAGKLTSEALICAMLAVGWICDQRTEQGKIHAQVLEDALYVIGTLSQNEDALVAVKCEKVATVACKMMQGIMLEQEEEEFLLTKLELMEEV